MSSIIRSLDKRSGITYVYQSTSYWDKEKKAPRSKRVCELPEKSTLKSF